MEINPDEYDLIVIGTGLQESLIAAAAAKQEKTVLHLDPSSYYGSLWTSFQLDQFLEWCKSHGTNQSRASGTGIYPDADAAPSACADARPQTQPAANISGTRFAHNSTGEDTPSAMSAASAESQPPSMSQAHAISQSGSEQESAASASPAEQTPVQQFAELAAKEGIYSHAEVHRAERAELGPSREYNIDMAPRVVHCAGSLINALLDAGAQNYLEFKLLQQSYVWREGRYLRVPASRADIFKDRALSPVDKRALMRFLQKAQQRLLAQPGAPQEGLEAEQPFVEMLRQEGLAPPLRDVIMYALACISVSQEGPALTNRLVSSAQGMAALARYMESVGRYGADTAAFLVPMYGGGELPQAFCRVAAVAGALYVLRQPVAHVMLMSSPGGRVCTGVTTGSGQVLKCKALAASCGTLEALLPGYSALSTAESAPTAAESAQQRHSQAVAIIDRPLQEDENQVLVVLPPGAVDNPDPVFVLQVGAATACAPAGRFLLYLSTPSEASTAAEDLRPALEALLDMRGLSAGDASTSAADAEEPSASDRRPNVLLAAYYNRVASSSASAQQHLPGNVVLCDPPDATIGYEEVIQRAQALLQRLFPDVQGGLFPGGGDAGGDDSDEEAIEALSEALGDLGAPTANTDKDA